MPRLPRYRPVKRCAFCTGRSDSREHAWPDWVLRRFRGPNNRIIGQIGGDEHYDPTQKAIRVRCVCRRCNTGWMKLLEDDVLPCACAMMNDLAIPLDPDQQLCLARWAVKTAMVFEYISRGDRALFYTDEERAAMRMAGTIPSGTRVQFARYQGSFTTSTFGADGDTIPVEPGQVSTSAFVTTMTFVHLAIQVFTLRARVGERVTVTARPGLPWDGLVRTIWPTQRVVHWPPPLTLNVHASVRDFHSMWHNTGGDGVL
jgi:hypothetical protein